MKYKPRFGKLVYNGYSCMLCNEPLYHNDPRKAKICVTCALQQHSELFSRIDLKKE